MLQVADVELMSVKRKVGKDGKPDRASLVVFDEDREETFRFVTTPEFCEEALLLEPRSTVRLHCRHWTVDLRQVSGGSQWGEAFKLTVSGAEVVG